MSTKDVRSKDASGIASVKKVDMKLAAVVIPVSDVDRGKEFYGSLGWRLDADFVFDNSFRGVQFTPGSGARFNSARTLRRPRPARPRGLYLIVSDIEAARGELVARGVDVSEVFHAGSPGAQFQPDGTSGRARRPARIAPATAPSPRSATRTATAGCCRRSRRGCPAGSTPLRRHSDPRRTWRARFVARRPATASTRGAPGGATRTGRTGTPHTWWRSRPGRSCRRERLRRQGHRRRGGGRRALPLRRWLRAGCASPWLSESWSAASATSARSLWRGGGERWWAEGQFAFKQGADCHRTDSPGRDEAEVPGQRARDRQRGRDRTHCSARVVL
jgi:catechol 2,3-dioxygenase-like lactoylglutathione lyase family enzyme